MFSLFEVDRDTILLHFVVQTIFFLAWAWKLCHAVHEIKKLKMFSWNDFTKLSVSILKCIANYHRTQGAEAREENDFLKC